MQNEIVSSGFKCFLNNGLAMSLEFKSITIRLRFLQRNFMPLRDSGTNHKMIDVIAWQNLQRITDQIPSVLGISVKILRWRIQSVIWGELFYSG